MMMVGSHCLLQDICCHHKESPLGPYALLISFLFVLSINISLHNVFPKRYTHIILQYQNRKKFPVSVHCLPHQLRSLVSRVYFLHLLVCLDIKNKSTGCNTHLLLLLIKMFSQRTMYMTLPVSITWIVSQISSSKAFHGST